MAHSAANFKQDARGGVTNGYFAPTECLGFGVSLLRKARCWVRIASRGAEHRIGRGPVGETAVDRDRHGAHLRQRAGALVTADVGDHLVVIGVAEAALHRLDVTAEFRGELIDEKRIPGLEFPARHGHVAVLVDEALGDPLIPAGDEHKRRIHLQRPLPLLGETQPLGGPPLVLRRLPSAVETAADGRGRVLGHAHADLLGLVRCLVPAGRLRVVIEPRPLVAAVREPRVTLGPGPRVTDREKPPHLRGQTVRRTEQQRLAAPHEPMLPPPAGLVECLIEVLHRARAVGVGKVGEPRRAHARRLEFIQHFQQRVAHPVVGQGDGDIQAQHIHPGIGQHLHVLAQHIADQVGGSSEVKS